MADNTMQLVLIRHGESEWNKLNLFTGWMDVDLTDTGRKEAAQGGRALSEAGFDFDICYTSYLKRAIHTLNLVLESMDREWLPVIKSWRLNERHYGALQGLNKAETAAKYGEEQVRSGAAALMFVLQRSKKMMSATLVCSPPTAMPLQMKCLWPNARRHHCPCLAYFTETIEPQMRAGKRVLIVAHGNSLRALVKQFDKLSDDEIVGVNIPTGVPLVYTFDQDFNVLDKRYVGDEATIAAKIDAVANQGKAK